MNNPSGITSPRKCPKCGYSLWGLRDDRCPECGLCGVSLDYQLTLRDECRSKARASLRLHTRVVVWATVLSAIAIWYENGGWLSVNGVDAILLALFYGPMVVATSVARAALRRKTSRAAIRAWIFVMLAWTTTQLLLVVPPAIGLIIRDDLLYMDIIFWPHKTMLPAFPVLWGGLWMIVWNWFCIRSVQSMRLPGKNRIALFVVGNLLLVLWGVLVYLFLDVPTHSRPMGFYIFPSG